MAVAKGSIASQGIGIVTPVASEVARLRFGSRLVDAARYVISGVTPASWFGPNQPLAPVAPEGTGGRQWDYPVALNLNYTPRSTEAINFATLRALADNLPILRTVIETRKDQIAAMDWDVKVKGEKDKQRGTKNASGKPDARIQKVKDFLEFPNRRNSFEQWIRMLVEDMLVIDAATVYPHKTRAGDPYSFDVIDGATIKPLIGLDGRTPDAPDPAYQQVLKGVPAADFTTDELMYLPRNVRTNRIYGFSPVEQIIMTVNIALRRDAYTLNYYKEGTLPDAFGGLPKEWTSDQVAAFQTHFDSLLTDNLAERRKMRFMPGEFKYQEVRQPPLKDQYDEWLTRVICYAFSVPVSAFVSQVNRATGESLRLQASQEGLVPLQRWLKGALDRIINFYFGFADLEFTWVDDETIDPLEQAQTHDLQIRNGTKSIDECRDELGLDASGMVWTSQGAMPEADAKTLTQATITGAAKPPVALAPGAGAPPKQGELPAPAKPAGGKKGSGVGKAADLPFPAGATAKSASTDRKVAKQARKAIKAELVKAFGLIRSRLVAHARVTLAHLAKAGDASEAARLAAALAAEQTLSELQAAADEIADQLQDVAAGAASDIVFQLGADANNELVNQVNERAVAWARERAAELVGKRYDDVGNLVDHPDADFAITDSTRDMIRNTITSGLEDNIGLDAIVDQLQDAYAFSDDRAELIATTEVANANEAASLIGARGVRDSGAEVLKGWLTAGDDKVCDDLCAANEAQGFIDLDQEFESGDDAPLAHPRCLPGGSLVLATGIRAATKRWFDGDLVVIRTASGKQLECTANHPILSSVGWVSAGALDVGSDIIGVRLREWVTLGHVDDQNVPARIEEIAEAFGRSGHVSAREVPVAAPDFHGDGIGSEVAVVWANRRLRNDSDVALREHPGEVDFGASGVVPGHGDLVGPHALLADGLNATSRASVGKLGLVDAGDVAHSGPFESFGFRSPPNADARFDESASNKRPVRVEHFRDPDFGDTTLVGGADRLDRNVLPSREMQPGAVQDFVDPRNAEAEFFGNFYRAQGLAIELDAVIDISRRRFSGHVFNLETEAGFYVADGIITHNCRCTLIYKADDGGADQSEEDGDDGE